ncbi:MAG: cytochrome c maturation protein CcmE [Dehalococcoidia bacterium]|jgi:cytochrome c-type biogenesis protein CcmE|nr:cytochrome c maturation protein CcmE [Dehalococcoidia bacterium]
MTNNSNNNDQHQRSDAPAVSTTARTSTLMGPRAKLGFALVLVAAALAYFAFTAFQGATVSYLSVAQALSEGPTAADRQMGVSGKLVQDSFVRDPDGLTAYFSLKDEDGVKELAVTYRGEIGQVFFNDHSEIILQGQKLVDGSFNADDLTVRCPSKYLTEAEQAELEAQENGDPVPPPYQPDYFDREA